MGTGYPNRQFLRAKMDVQITRKHASKTRHEMTPMCSVGGLSDEDVDRIARRVIELMSDQTVREISWDVIPDLAEIVIKDRIRELENQVD